jgi:hypothetical protein
MRDRAHFGLSMSLMIVASLLLSAHVNDSSPNCFRPVHSTQPSVHPGNSSESNAILQTETVNSTDPTSAQSTTFAFQIRGSFPQYRPAISR